MRTQLDQFKRRTSLWLGAPSATTLLVLAALTARGGTPYTATGCVNQVLAPGIICSNTLAQVLVRGNVQVLQVNCANDARLTGRRTVFMDGAFQADGSLSCYGAAYAEVGTWSGTNFTPTGGMWQLNWSGVMQANYSLQVSLAGYGSGGNIDGLRLEETLTRGPASSASDPTVPTQHTGTIQPPPVSTDLVSDDFNNGVHDWVTIYPCGAVSIFPTNQAYGMRANFSGCPSDQSFVNTHPSSGGWSLADGQTLECRADLVRVSEDSTNTAFLIVGGDPGLYFFVLGQTGAGLCKWTRATHPYITYFWWDNTVQVPRTNVVLNMALTRDQESLIIATRLLDKADTNTVHFGRSFIDTPQADASLTTAQLRALSGYTATLVGDPGAPIFGAQMWSGSPGGGGLGLDQSPGGTRPPMEAVWDNFSMRLHDVPPISIARAVQLSWPVPSGVNYSVEAAPSLQGPWMPVQELEMPGMQKTTFPLGGSAQFFRLVQGP